MAPAETSDQSQLIVGISVTASPPYPARYRTRTLNRDFVIASEAWRSMTSGVMDCVTAFAMTGLFMESTPNQPRYRARALNRHRERSVAIHAVRGDGLLHCVRNDNVISH